MNKYPKYIEVNSTKYEINTDFRVALKCDEVVRDDSICEYEKVLAIIYLLLGDKGLGDEENHSKMIKPLMKYLRCGKDLEDTNQDSEPSMDFKQDTGYIKASFMSDYGIELDNAKMHWWAFFDLLNGLTENSVLNRVRMIREEPLSGKKGKELEKWQKMKKQVELKREKTEKEKELDKYWEKILKKGSDSNGWMASDKNENQ